MKPSASTVTLPVVLLSIGPALAHAQAMCIVAGNQPIMGANMTSDFDVQAGQGCMYDITPRGTLSSSEINQRPQHGTLQMIDKDTWTYTPAPGYSGPDSFVITAQGRSFNVNVK